jgi:hypothetical protein
LSREGAGQQGVEMQFGHGVGWNGGLPQRGESARIY